MSVNSGLKGTKKLKKNLIENQCIIINTLRLKKIYNNRVYRNFQHNKIPKDNKYFAYLSVILSNSIFINSDKEYYPQVLLEECKYAIKNEKIVNTINEDLKLSESDDE